MHASLTWIGLFLSASLPHSSAVTLASDGYKLPPVDRGGDRAAMHRLTGSGTHDEPRRAPRVLGPELRARIGVDLDRA